MDFQMDNKGLGFKDDWSTKNHVGKNATGSDLTDIADALLSDLRDENLLRISG